MTLIFQIFILEMAQTNVSWKTTLNKTWIFCYINILTGPMLKSVSDCCFSSNEQFFSHILAKTSYIWWDDVQFIL